MELQELVPKLIDGVLNTYGFGTSSWKNRQRPGFSTKIKLCAIFPKFPQKHIKNH
jgi:hypothetical protein